MQRLQTCPTNGVVAPIHSKAMPVILTTPQEFDRWLSGEDAQAMQRPLPDDALRIAARGEKEDR